MECPYEKFWRTSGINVNYELRENIFDINNHESKIHKYYRKNLLLMSNLMKENKTKNDMLCYRSIHLHDFDSARVGDIVHFTTFISCFTDCIHNGYGPIEIFISVPEGTNYLQYGDTIIFGPSDLRLTSKDMYTYNFTLIKSHSIV